MQLTLEVRAFRLMFSKSQGRLKLSDFLLKFDLGDDTPSPLSQEELRHRAQASKSRWLGALGLGPDGRPRPKK